MGLEVETVVDCHCHMFTVGDVPLHGIVTRQVKHPFRLLLGALAAGVAVKWYKRFIKFFEQESIQNVEQVADEMDKAMQSGALGEYALIAGERVLTPLAMDFDINGDVDKSHGQVDRLTNAAVKFGEKTGKAVKVLPFVGLDPRKLIYDDPKNNEILPADSIRDRVNRFMENYRVQGISERKYRAGLASGDVIGIKLYPPLGFDACPDPVAERKAFFVVYECLAEQEIPITVHCQEASFDLSDGDMERFTKPENWLRVLGASQALGRLRINLGHFGGEKGVVGAVEWQDQFDETVDCLQTANGPAGRGWTREIIRILKRYDNAFSDISAFDFGDKKAVASLLWILSYDRQGRFDEPGGPNHPLLEKLLWGSDYPMILDKDYRDYMTYFADFVNTVINREPFREMTDLDLPRESLLPAPDELLIHMVSQNPVRFLFG